MLAGSAAVGTSDEHSDIDLLNYYDELPAPATFTELMRSLGAEPMGEIGEPTAEGFGASFRDPVNVGDPLQLLFGSSSLTGCRCRARGSCAIGRSVCRVSWCKSAAKRSLGDQPALLL